MNNHLSEEQISKWIAGISTVEEREHLRECRECDAAAERFSATLSLFRNAVRDRANRQMVSAIPRRLNRLHWRWAPVGIAAVVAALIVLTVDVIPVYKNPSVPELPAAKSEKRATNDDVLLMQAVSAHLSRVVPAPMEPVMALLPKSEADKVQGGNR